MSFTSKEERKRILTKTSVRPIQGKSTLTVRHDNAAHGGLDGYGHHSWPKIERNFFLNNTAENISSLKHCGNTS